MNSRIYCSYVILRKWQRKVELAFRASSPGTPTAIPRDPQSGTGMEPASQFSEAVGEEDTEQTYVGTQSQNRGKGGGPHLQAHQQLNNEASEFIHALQSTEMRTLSMSRSD